MWVLLAAGRKSDGLYTVLVAQNVMIMHANSAGAGLAAHVHPGDAACLMDSTIPRP